MPIDASALQPLEFHTFALVGKRRTIAGSMIGGIGETQEMIDFCGEQRCKYFNIDMLVPILSNFFISPSESAVELNPKP